MRVSLACLLLGFLCVQGTPPKLGDLCSVDSHCPTNAKCFEDACTCNNGYRGYNGRVCKLALDQACNKTTDCGENTKCEGDPPVCKCKGGFVSQHGRCGRKMGKTCSSYSECMSHVKCTNGICNGCYWGYRQIDDYCAKKHECSYYLKEAQLEKFYDTMTAAYYHYDVFPCRYKMAHFHCSGYDVDVTVEHGVTIKTNFYAKSSTGGVYVSDVTVTLKSNNSDSTVTSQINRLNTKDFAKYMKAADFTESPWTWSYEGQKPRRKHRVEGKYGSFRAVVIKDQLSVTYSDKYSDLDIACGDQDFRSLTNPAGTICGFPSDSDYRAKKELEAKSKAGQNVLSYGVLDSYIALAKQDAQQTNPQCQEARTVLTGQCENLGGVMKTCGDVYTTRWVSSPGRCLRKNSVDSFKVYVACLKLLCGTGGKTKEDCDVFRAAQVNCGVGLYSQAKCTSQM
ncbi:uncharacterized protein [Littorina saxatilis]|uniref:EGF-like domain-containing protein n=1 Tax=Littorina saxatilis TaxID=31220 RepID=A0AAN9G7I3_9CAEN